MSDKILQIKSISQLHENIVFNNRHIVLSPYFYYQYLCIVNDAPRRLRWGILFD